MQFWITLWTIVWFGGLLVFTVLSALVIVFGLRDLVCLLRSLQAKHSQGGETTETSAPTR